MMPSHWCVQGKGMAKSTRKKGSRTEAPTKSLQRKVVRPVSGKPAHGSPPPIGPKLRQYRLKENMTLADLQALTGISKSMLSQIERGAVNPTFARVWRLTRSLGIGVGELLGEVKTGLDAPHIYEHRKFDSTPAITSADGLCITRILSPIRQALPVEWYEMVL
jgi:transcriptional regulator with XRE-family HTH domain